MTQDAVTYTADELERAVRLAVLEDRNDRELKAIFKAIERIEGHVEKVCTIIENTVKSNSTPSTSMHDGMGD